MTGPVMTGPENGTADEEVAVVRNAVKRFGATTALNDLSLTVRRGESHGLVGRNGAGKSTLVSVLTGLRGLDSGSLHLGGRPAQPLTDRKAWMSAVSCVYQHRTLVPDMTVAENLYLGVYENRPLVNWRSLNTKARTELERWEIPISPTQKGSPPKTRGPRSIWVAGFGESTTSREGPRYKLNPRALNSLPITAPTCWAISVFHVAPIAIGLGSGVRPLRIWSLGVPSPSCEIPTNKGT